MAARIKLIVTGDMERSALHKSLQRIFPSERHGQPVVWDVPHLKVGGSPTNNQLKSGHRPNGAMRKLARIMLSEATMGIKGVPADLIVVVDDVELGNIGREHIVAEHFCTAVRELLGQYNGAELVRHQAILREKCSFHLLKPMPEAYFFGDPDTLIALVSPGANPKLVHPSDVEKFETNEPAYLPACRNENSKKQLENKPWWRQECHPKDYIIHLAERNRKTYDEIIHGKQALLNIDWKKVPKYQTDTLIIRSLFADIADWFGIQNPICGDTDPAFYPAYGANHANLLLRNL